MLISKNPIERNAYLISTSFKSFGYIISCTDERAHTKSENFFESFRFSPEITSKLFELLRSGAPITAFAKDDDSNGFLFCQSSISAGVFAFIKRIDINPDEVATIIRESLSDSIICLNGNHMAYSEESYYLICQTAKDLMGLISAHGNKYPRLSDMALSASNISDGISINQAPIERLNIKASDEYVFCACGFSLLLSFLYMTKANIAIDLSPYGHSCHVVRANISASNSPDEETMQRLEFLRGIMDAQNLNMFFTTSENEIKITLLPYYIDDGLHGVKANITLEEL